MLFLSRIKVSDNSRYILIFYELIHDKMKSKEEILIEKPCFEYSTMENRYYEWSDILDAMEEYAQQQVKNLQEKKFIE